MEGYIESALSKGEQVAYQGKVSMWSLVPLMMIGFIIPHISSLLWVGVSVLGRCCNQVLHNRTCTSRVD